MIKKIAGLVVVIALFSGCGDKPAATQAVPLGDKAALEQLADSWEGLSEKRLAASPASLPGDERKRFLEQVFADAGYNYTATLKEMAVQGIDKGNNEQIDLAELVLLPHRTQRGTPMDPADIYSIEELQAVAAIERSLNKP